MAHYRLYALTAGKLTQACWHIHCDDDSAAALTAREIVPNGTAELWAGDRLVLKAASNPMPDACRLSERLRARLSSNLTL